MNEASGHEPIIASVGNVNNMLSGYSFQNKRRKEQRALESLRVWKT